MKKIFSTILVCLVYLNSNSQEYVIPAPKNNGFIAITNGTVHVGNGVVLEGATVLIKDEKIIEVGKNVSVPANSKQIDAKSKQIYPGLILPYCNLGLEEISGIDKTTDKRETGYLNPNVRSISAYNTDSKIINTLKSNGILLANIVPQGEVAGSASVVQLDAWSYIDAAYKTDIGICISVPMIDPSLEGASNSNKEEDLVRKFFIEARYYFNNPKPEVTNLKFESVRGLFEKTTKLFVSCHRVAQILKALEYKDEFGFNMIIVGGGESNLVADMLKLKNVPVIIIPSHRLPTYQNSELEEPYKLAASLQAAGVLYAINDDGHMNRGRNLPFNAGTYAAYGLTKEEALQAITLNTAKILGIDDKTGSIEAGKDANIIISEGDILDMRTSIVTDAFIQGRKVDLNDKQKQLYQKYKKRYGIN